MKEISILFTHHERGRENEFTRGFKSLTFGFYDLTVWPQSLTALVNEPGHTHCLYTHTAKIWNVVVSCLKIDRERKWIFELHCRMKNTQKSKSAGLDINSSKQTRSFSRLHNRENNQNRSLSDDREKKKAPLFISLNYKIISQRWHIDYHHEEILR